MSIRLPARHADAGDRNGVEAGGIDCRRDNKGEIGLGSYRIIFLFSFHETTRAKNLFFTFAIYHIEYHIIRITPSIP
jgi:hypothetical protein